MMKFFYLLFKCLKLAKNTENVLYIDVFYDNLFLQIDSSWCLSKNVHKIKDVFTCIFHMLYFLHTLQH